ncbi:MAG TPA: isocitrate lyase/phosphoenolpyruvate mutase family protein [Gammaproteobacteria bacterium]|nr:isocitrate lyase/phosphoenolpyruvate mutase family protein [Gammaproteobacteria bacterium]
MNVGRNKAELIRRAETLRALHHGQTPLLMLNIWDAASAVLVESLGFPALATTSSGMANALGYPDGEQVARADMLAAVARITRSIEVPVSADLEAGYGDDETAVVETVQAAIAAGVAGFNLEDSRGDRLLPFEQAVSRVRAARQAAEAAGVPLVINARSDALHPGYVDGDAFAEAVRRANAYREAGADCLFLPFVSDAGIIGRLVTSVDGPINILAGANTPPLPELARLGVARVSVGGALARAALGRVREVAEGVRQSGRFDFVRGIPGHDEMNTLLAGRPQPVK